MIAPKATNGERDAARARAGAGGGAVLGADWAIQTV
jgi:hypothetical protein